MSNAPYLLPKARFGYRLGDGALVDLMTHDGLDLDASTAGTWSSRRRSSRASSASRARTRTPGRCARTSARSPRSTTAASRTRSCRSESVATDEGPRRDTSLEKLAALKPVFDPEGTTTAGNAPGVNDGAGALVVASEELAQSARARAPRDDRRAGYVADDFAYLARTPAGAGQVALDKAGKTIGDVERVEINEAFCSVALNSTRMLGADPETRQRERRRRRARPSDRRSGARLLTTLIYELRREGGGLGLAAICSGGGQGDALLLEV